MKNILKSTLLMLCAVAFMAACSDDRDSNPTIKTPTNPDFLNTPPYAALNTDLASGGTLPFTWSQPDYGFPVKAEYTLQVSLDGNYTVSYEEAEADETETLVADYTEVGSTVTVCNNEIDAADLAKALQQVAKWKEDNVPATQDVYVRVKSSVKNFGDFFSTPVVIKVVPMYVELSDAPVEQWYLIGSCIGDGYWTNSADAVATSVIPMYQKASETYDKKTGQGVLTYTGYLTTDGFKLVKELGNWDIQWGEKDGAFVKNDGGSGNITVAENGYYTVELNTATDELTITAVADPAEYTQMLIAGDFNGWSTSTAMTAVNTFGGAKNHDWYYDLDASDGATTAKFLTDDSWSVNWGSDTFPVGWGTQNGPNIPVAAGNYRIIFNDITGAYNFITKE